MKKFIITFFALFYIVTIGIFTSACNTSTTELGESEQESTTEIKYPIDSITLSHESQAMPVGGSFTITAKISPSYTDDYITWSSTDETILSVDDNGKVNVIGVGTAGIVAKAANGSARASVSFKIMPTFDSSGYVSSCKSVADSAILTIKNKCYNTFLGITTSSETITFTAIIIKNIGTTYYFLTGYDNFAKIDGYDYQDWTAIDCNGKEYDINAIQYEDNKTLGVDYRQAVGSINASNLGVLSITSRGTYYDKETLFVKSGNTYIGCNKDGTEAATSPMDTDLTYSDSLYGSPVLDCEYNFVGMIIRSNTNGCAEFIATWHMIKFIGTCGISV